MQISLILMEEIAKLFLIMFMGYALVKTKLLRVRAGQQSCIGDFGLFGHPVYDCSRISDR